MMSILFCGAATLPAEPDEPGPFERLFRAMRHAGKEPKHKSEHRNRHKQIDEGENLRGTAGALRLAVDREALGERFLVLYGDSYLPTDFRAVWARFLSSGKPALMTVYKNAGRWDASNVVFAEGELKLYDKFASPGQRKQMEYIDYGLSAFTSACLRQHVPAGATLDLAEVFKRLSERGELAAYEVFARFYEIGSPAGLEEFRRFMRAIAGGSVDAPERPKG